MKTRKPVRDFEKCQRNKMSVKTLYTPITELKINSIFHSLEGSKLTIYIIITNEKKKAQKCK